MVTGQSAYEPATAPANTTNWSVSSGYARVRGSLRALPAARLAQVANGHDDAVPGQHVTGELTCQRAGGERTERPRLPSVQQHALGIAVCSEMTMMAEMERAVEVDRQQERNADHRVHDEVVHPPASRDETVDAVMIEDEDRMLSRGDEERGKDDDRSAPPANRRCRGGNDERPLDEERRKARKMERGPRRPRVAGPSDVRDSEHAGCRASRPPLRTSGPPRRRRRRAVSSGASMPPGQRSRSQRRRQTRCQNRAVAGSPWRRASSHDSRRDGGRQRDMAARDGAERRVQLLDEREQRSVGRDRASGDARRHEVVDDGVGEAAADRHSEDLGEARCAPGRARSAPAARGNRSRRRMPLPARTG